MFKKLKSEFGKIKWANRKLVFTDMKIVILSSVILMLVITLIEWLSKLFLNLIF